MNLARQRLILVWILALTYLVNSLVLYLMELVEVFRNKLLPMIVSFVVFWVYVHQIALLGILQDLLSDFVLLLRRSGCINFLAELRDELFGLVGFLDYIDSVNLTLMHSDHSGADFPMVLARHELFDPVESILFLCLVVEHRCHHLDLLIGLLHILLRLFGLFDHCVDLLVHMAQLLLKLESSDLNLPKIVSGVPVFASTNFNLERLVDVRWLS